MPNIEMRLGKDCLACGAPYEHQLASLGFEDECTELLNLTDEESISQLHRLNLLAGAQCLLTHTARANRIDLLSYDLAEQAVAINREALKNTARLKPEHLLVRMRVHEIGFEEGLEQDAEKNPLASCYQEQARAYGSENEQASDEVPSEGPDAFLLEGVGSQESALFALGALREVTQRPIFVLYDKMRWNVDVTDLAVDCAATFSMLCMNGFQGVGVSGFGPEDSCARVHELSAVRDHFLVNHPDHQTYPAVLVFVDVTNLTPQALEMWIEKLLKAGADLIGVTGQATAAHVGAVRGVVDVFNRYGESGLIA